MVIKLNLVKLHHQEESNNDTYESSVNISKSFSYIFLVVRLLPVTTDIFYTFKIYFFLHILCLPNVNIFDFHSG